jgi:hypothetical protein
LCASEAFIGKANDVMARKFGFHDSWHTRGFYERAAVISVPAITANSRSPVPAATSPTILEGWALKTAIFDPGFLDELEHLVAQMGKR